ncbi:MAG: site-2 protease family protein [Candidatus Margulisbacteria bacterium]|nr:site-2 protease family protein [Candidatus Margulisiibacteriota bacterium]
MILIIILQLTLIVLVHELGHYLLARLAGVQVLGFNIGFGPVVWKTLRGGTQYALRLVPLGGYVQLYGLDETPRKMPAKYSYGKKKLWQRFAIISGGALFNIIFAWALFVGLYLSIRPFAFWPATAAFWRFVSEFLQGLAVFFRQPDLGALSGPIGILGISAESVRRGWQSFWFFTAFLSLNLGVINLLPFPALDGGRLIFLAVELVLRRPPPPAVERWVHGLGFILLLWLMFLLSFQDVARLGK